jgi:hypothetical protein
VSGDTVIDNAGTGSAPVYRLKPVTVSGQAIGAGIKYLHITTNRAQRFYIHGLYSNRSVSGTYSRGINIHCFDSVGTNLLLMQATVAEDAEAFPDGVGTYHLVSTDGNTTCDIVVDWNLVNKSAWTSGGATGDYQATFRKLVTISEACVERTPTMASVAERVAALEDAVDELAGLVGG